MAPPDRARASQTPGLRARALLPAWLALALVLCASTPSDAHEAGQTLHVALLTMGPGDHPFTKFGHTAIWISDPLHGVDEVYNFGTFAFDSPTLFVDSVRGVLPYWLSVQTLRATRAAYAEGQRSLDAAELALTPAQRLELLEALRRNALPEHRYYRYDYYRDNCATRVRDALDRVLGGRLRQAGAGPARMTYREHTLRLVADDALLFVTLDLALGRRTDQPIRFWDEGFLPERLRDLVASTSVTRDGHTLPLIHRDVRLLRGADRPERARPPGWQGRYAAAGSLLGGLVVVAAWLGRRSAFARRGSALLLFSIGGVCGLLGLALAYLSLCSGHLAAHGNLNPLLLPPWALGLCVAALSMARGRPSGARWAFWAGAACLCGALLEPLLNALFEPAQANARVLAFALPLWACVTLAGWVARSVSGLGGRRFAGVSPRS